jgi:hypothetical protein
MDTDTLSHLSEISRDNLDRRYRYSPYSPLDITSGHIRLVQLLPGNDEPVRIKLIHCSLAELAYNVLSHIQYEDEDEDDKSVECEGHTIRIPPTLYQFLQLLRQSGHVEPLWIDGICIDDDIDKESDYLMQKLPFIYHTAQRTLFWFGLGDFQALQEFTSTTLGVQSYQKTMAECLSTVDILHSTYRIVEHDLEVFEKEAEMFDRDTWQALDTFLDRVYLDWYVESHMKFFH